MLRRQTVAHCEGFLTRIEQGEATDHRLRYCRVEFNVTQYSTNAFSEFGVTLPAHISKAVVKRQAEYLAGRICCKKILECMKIDQEVASNYPERAPVWPDGLAGSISHCGATAIAIITNNSTGHVGIDIERLNEKLMEAHSGEFTSSDERQWLKGPQELLIAFSAKEALFKALYPRLKIYFGFDCAAVKIIDDALFTIRLTCSLGLGYPKHRSWTGWYCQDACVVTTLLIDPNNPTSVSSTCFRPEDEPGVQVQ